MAPAAPAVAAAAEGLSLAALLKELVGKVTDPEMIRALSPTEGFEAKPHTFQAIETEGRWKTPPDWLQGDSRYLAPPANKTGTLQKYQATILSIEFEPIDPQFLSNVFQLAFAAAFPPAQIAMIANKVVSVGSEKQSPANITQAFRDLLSSLIPPTQLETSALQSLSNKNLKPPLAQILASTTQVIPSIARALADIQTGTSTAEIEAVWWSDGFEIYAGQAAAKHVTGFGSLFGHQARVELDGVSYGNYFPLSYCLTFTGFVNPVGPTFEELRGAVKLAPDGTATGLFGERANRDKDKPDSVSYSGKDGGGYRFKYSGFGKPSK